MTKYESISIEEYFRGQEWLPPAYIVGDLVGTKFRILSKEEFVQGVKDNQQKREMKVAFKSSKKNKKWSDFFGIEVSNPGAVLKGGIIFYIVKNDRFLAVSHNYMDMTRDEAERYLETGEEPKQSKYPDWYPESFKGCK